MAKKKKDEPSVPEKILAVIIGVPGAIVFGLAVIVLLFSLIFNVAGLMFGFEKNSDACSDYRNKTRSNFSYYMFPITGYACRPNGGLLQPAVKDVFEWFGKDHDIAAKPSPTPAPAPKTYVVDPKVRQLIWEYAESDKKDRLAMCISHVKASAYSMGLLMVEHVRITIHADDSRPEYEDVGYDETNALLNDFTSKQLTLCHRLYHK